MNDHDIEKNDKAANPEHINLLVQTLSIGLNDKLQHLRHLSAPLDKSAHQDGSQDVDDFEEQVDQLKVEKKPLIRSPDPNDIGYYADTYETTFTVEQVLNEDQQNIMRNKNGFHIKKAHYTEESSDSLSEEDKKKIFSNKWYEDNAESIWFNKNGTIMITLSKDEDQKAIDIRAIDHNDIAISYKLTMYKIDKSSQQSYFSQFLNPQNIKAQNLILTVKKDDWLKKEQNDPIISEDKGRLHYSQNTIFDINETLNIVMIFEKYTQRIFIAYLGSEPIPDDQFLDQLVEAKYCLHPFEFIIQEIYDAMGWDIHILPYYKVQKLFFLSQNKLQLILYKCDREAFEIYQLHTSIRIGLNGRVEVISGEIHISKEAILESKDSYLEDSEDQREDKEMLLQIRGNGEYLYKYQDMSIITEFDYNEDQEIQKIYKISTLRQDKDGLYKEIEIVDKTDLEVQEKQFNGAAQIQEDDQMKLVMLLENYQLVKFIVKEEEDGNWILHKIDSKIDLSPEFKKDYPRVWLLKQNSLGDIIFAVYRQQDREDEFMSIVAYNLRTKAYVTLCLIEQISGSIKAQKSSKNNMSLGPWAIHDQYQNVDLLVFNRNRLINIQEINYINKVSFDTKQKLRIYRGVATDQTEIFDQQKVFQAIYEATGLDYYQMEFQYIIEELGLITIKYQLNVKEQPLTIIYRPYQKLIYVLKGYNFFQSRICPETSQYKIFFLKEREILCYILYEQNLSANKVLQIYTIDKITSVFISYRGNDFVIESETASENHQKQQASDNKLKDTLVPDHIVKQLKDQANTPAGPPDKNDKGTKKEEKKIEKSIHNYAHYEYQTDINQFHQKNSGNIDIFKNSNAFKQISALQLSDQIYDSYVFFKKTLLSELEKKRLFKSIEYQDHKVHPYHKWYIIFKIGEDRIHFVEKEQLNIVLTIKVPFQLNEYASDEVIEGDFYISEKNTKQFYQLRMFKDEPGYLPLELIINKNFYTELDISGKEKRVRYFEDYLSKTKLLAQFRIYDDYLLECHSHKLQKMIEDPQSYNIEDIFGLNIIYRFQKIKNILEKVQDDKSLRVTLFEPLIKKIEDPKNQESQSIQFFLLNYKLTDTCLMDILTSLKPQIQKQLLSSLIQHIISTDTTGLLYENLIDEYFENITSVGIDVKMFLSSQIAYHKIEGEDEDYPEYGIIKDQLYSAHQNSIYSVKNSYNEIFNIKNSEKQKDLESNKNGNQRIQYHVVNLKNMLNKKNSLTFLNQIYEICEKDITILDIPCIKAIIEFKWKTFTYRYFFMQLIAMILFYMSFIADLFYWNQLYGSDTSINSYIAARIICLGFISGFFILEFIQILKKYKEYFQEMWNYNDILLFLIYLVYFILTFTSHDQLYVIKIFQCLVVLISFVKFCFLIRIFEKLSFLVSMLGSVFRDIGYFLLFFAIVIGAFSTGLAIIVQDNPDGYEGIDQISYFAIALRRSIGDNDTEEVLKGSSYKVLAWLHWLAIVIVGNIVFMNFVIAVVGSSYENYMEKSVSQSYKAKLHMIIERESVMMENSKDNKNWFPPYIVKCEIAEEEGLDNADQWQGIVKQIKRSLDKNTINLQKEVKQQGQAQSDINHQLKSLSKKMEQIIQFVTHGKTITEKKEDEHFNDEEDKSDPSDNINQSLHQEEKAKVLTYYQIQNDHSKFYMQQAEVGVEFQEEEGGKWELIGQEGVFGSYKLMSKNSDDVQVCINVEANQEFVKISKDFSLSTIYWSLINTGIDQYYIKWINNNAIKRYLDHEGKLVQSKSDTGTVWNLKKIENAITEQEEEEKTEDDY